MIAIWRRRDAVFKDRHLHAILIEDDRRGGTISRRLAPDLQFDSAIDPRLQRIGNPRHRAMKGEVEHRGHANDGLDAGLDAKGGVLRDVNPDPDHVAATAPHP